MPMEIIKENLDCESKSLNLKMIHPKEVDSESTSASDKESNGSVEEIQKAHKIHHILLYSFALGVKGRNQVELGASVSLKQLRLKLPKSQKKETIWQLIYLNDFLSFQSYFCWSFLWIYKIILNNRISKSSSQNSKEQDWNQNRGKGIRNSQKDGHQAGQEPH